MSDKQWRTVLRQLITLGYLQVGVAGFGGLYLTRKSPPLLRGEQNLQLRLDRKHKRQQSWARRDAPPIEIEDNPLLEALRMRLAKEQDVPPFVIFHDSVLHEMMARRPLDDAAMAAVPGVGETKLAAYGLAFIEVSAAHAQRSAAGTG